MKAFLVTVKPDKAMLFHNKIADYYECVIVKYSFILLGGTAVILMGHLHFPVMNFIQKFLLFESIGIYLSAVFFCLNKRSYHKDLFLKIRLSVIMCRDSKEFDNITLTFRVPAKYLRYL